MAPSATVTVVRYTALATGILYGFVHNRTVQKQHAQQQAHHKQHHQEELLAKAKEAWKQKQAASATVDDTVTDPEDPRFDLEKVIAKYESA
ncbi:hypothetical protein PENSPDRAFT_687958 [Peniophora sp. CONT]|nr:hypothetical protein PENSPDRAFT_687958 [Peniophora sp. CONT]